MLRLKVALAASAAVVVVVAAATAAVQLGDGGRSSIRRRLTATEMGERLAGWLTPPYLHVLLNAIILSIVASGLFWWPASDPAANFGTDHAQREAVEWSGEMKEVAWAEKDADSVEAERLSWSTELPTRCPEELPIAVPFGHQRNGESDTNIYKAARRKIRKPRRPPADSLESTWLAITEGRRGSRHNDLKELDTWSEATAGLDEDNVEAATSSEIISPPAAARLRRDPWPEQEELNRRVEAFIDKFNDEMRLQRQQSMQQFMDMINRGSR